MIELFCFEINFKLFSFKSGNLIKIILAKYSVQLCTNTNI